MKFLSIELFLRELKKECHNCFLVVIPSSYERQKVMNKIYQVYSHKGYYLSNFSAADVSVEKVIETLDTPMLFGGDPFVIIDEMHLYKKNELEKLIHYLKNTKMKSCLAMGSKDKKSILSCFNTVEQKGVVVDLVAEKIWDKERRLKSYFMKRCSIDGKTISTQTIESLFVRVGVDMEMVANEIDKLITFVGDKNTIDEEDVKAICATSNTTTIWQVAEKIVWSDEILSENVEKNCDATFFHSLIIAVRYHLEMGLKLSSFLESGLSVEKYLSYFPRMYPKTLEKRKKIAKERGSYFFKKALAELFKIDFLSKNNVRYLTTLIDVFKCRLTNLARK
jgi:hypothetical protein